MPARLSSQCASGERQGVDLGSVAQPSLTCRRPRAPSLCQCSADAKQSIRESRPATASAMRGSWCCGQTLPPPLGWWHFALRGWRGRSDDRNSAPVAAHFSLDFRAQCRLCAAGRPCSRHWPTDIDTGPVLLAVCAVAVAVQEVRLRAVIYSPSLSLFVQTTEIAIVITVLVAEVWTAVPAITASVCL